MTVNFLFIYFIDPNIIYHLARLFYNIISLLFRQKKEMFNFDSWLFSIYSIFQMIDFVTLKSIKF